MARGIKNRIAEISDIISFAGLVMTAFYLPISIAATNIGICLSIIFYLVKKISSRDWHLIKPGSTTVFIPLFFIFSVITIINSVDLKASSFGALKMVKYLSIYIIARETINNKKRLKIIIWSLVLGAFLASIDGMVQLFTGKDFIRGFNIEIGNPLEGRATYFKRIRAAFHNSQDFATYLAVIVPLLISLLRYGQYSAKKKSFLFFTLLCSLFCLTFTYSRGAALALLATCIFYTVIKRDKILLPVLLSIGLLAPFVLAKSPLLWVKTRPNFISLFYDSSRLQHWQAAINMAKAHPYMGVGLNAFVASYSIYKAPNDAFKAWYAHQAYLQLLAEVGLIGFILFMGIAFTAVKSSWKSYNKIVSPELKSISLGVFSGLLGFLICGLLESNLQYSNLAVIFWLVLTLNTGMKDIIAEKNSS